MNYLRTTGSFVIACHRATRTGASGATHIRTCIVPPNTNLLQTNIHINNNQT